MADNGNDNYDSWTWQQIETAILGGVDMSADKQAAARDDVSSPESFDTAGEHYEKAQNLLQKVHENIKTWADRIIGVEGHWQGKGARSFKQMTDTMLATVEALRVSLAGPPSYKETLHDAGVALQTAIDEIEEADRAGAQAAMDKYNEDPGAAQSPPWRTEGNTTIVAVSTYPEIEAEMTAKMRESIKKLAAAYQTAMGNLRDPGEPTFPLPGEDESDANPIPVAAPKPGSARKPLPKPSSNIRGKRGPQDGEFGTDHQDGKFGTDHQDGKFGTDHLDGEFGTDQFGTDHQDGKSGAHPFGIPGVAPTGANVPPETFHVTSAPPAGTLPEPAPNLFTAPSGSALDGLIGGATGDAIGDPIGGVIGDAIGDPIGGVIGDAIGGPIGDAGLVTQLTFGMQAPDISGYDPLTHVAGTGNMAFSGFAPGIISPDGAHFLAPGLGGPAGVGPALPAASAAGPYGGPLMPVTGGYGYGYGHGYGSRPLYVRSGYLPVTPGPVGTQVPESAFTAGPLPHENFISAPPGPAAGTAPGQDVATGAPIMPGMIGRRGPDEEGHDTASWLVEQDDSWSDGMPSNVSFLTRSER
jgi:hypothetical protein